MVQSDYLGCMCAYGACMRCAAEGQGCLQLLKMLDQSYAILLSLFMEGLVVADIVHICLGQLLNLVSLKKAAVIYDHMLLHSAQHERCMGAWLTCSSFASSFMRHASLTADAFWCEALPTPV